MGDAVPDMDNRVSRQQRYTDAEHHPADTSPPTCLFSCVDLVADRLPDTHRLRRFARGRSRAVLHSLRKFRLVQTVPLHIACVVRCVCSNSGRYHRRHPKGGHKWPSLSLSHRGNRQRGVGGLTRVRYESLRCQRHHQN